MFYKCFTFCLKLMGLWLLLKSAAVSANNLESNPVELTMSISHLNGENVLIDGELNEQQWQNASRVELGFITEPFENTKPQLQTQVLYFEDGKNLYLAFIAEDLTPQKIRARYSDRDDLNNEDIVGIRLDTSGDGRLGYEFATNPFGVQLDAIENEMTGQRNENWNAIWYSQGKITQSGYQVEFKLPLSVLSFAQVDGDKLWNAEFFRIIPREDRLKISNVPIDRNQSCKLCQLKPLIGFESLQQGSDLTIIPTLVAGKTQQRYSGQGDWDNVNDQEIGLDIIWGITPEFSLQATINPDFSQVEADAVQISVNNPFALFFDETRPFFLENSEYFNSNFDLVYTRNISSPDYGAKFTGSADDHTLALFLVEDETTTFLIPDNLGSEIAFLDSASTNLAGRYRYDFSNDFSIGGIGTIREADQYYNYMFGFDSKYQFSEQDSIEVQVVGSQTEYPGELFLDFCSNECMTDADLSETTLRSNQNEKFDGLAYRIDYQHNSRDWFAYANHVHFDQNFRADLGFESVSDHNKSVIGLGRIWYNEDSWWNELIASGDWDISHSDDGELIEKELEFGIEVLGAYQSFFEMGFINRNRVGLRQRTNSLAIDGNTTLFEENIIYAVGGATPSSNIEFNTYLSYGDQIDFSNNRLGKETVIEPELSLRLGEHFRFDSVLTYINLDVESEKLLTIKLADLRMGYHFDQRQFIRLVLTYYDVTRNPDNYTFSVDEKEQDLGLQFLYSYKLNPLTKFVLGYTDTFVRNQSIQNLKSVEKTIFMKLSYAFAF